MGFMVEDTTRSLTTVFASTFPELIPLVEKLQEHVERYYNEALELVSRDLQQAAEKLWDAITALVKLHVSVKKVFIAEWDHGKLYNYVTHNIEEEHRDLFHNLLAVGEVLHKYFYEGDLDNETFNIFWIKALKLLSEARQVVYKLYTKTTHSV
jgi:predicted PurR-regulated permease PerM